MFALIVFAVLTLGAPVLFGAVDFNRDIRPILSDNCFTCHGPDEKKRMANLRLDTPEAGLSRIVTAGDPNGSKLFQRVSEPNKARRMPPPGAGTTLTEHQIELLKQWIADGAKWENHWAFVAPKTPKLPDVRNEAWARNPIDRFVS